MTVLAADKIPAPFPENSETAISAWFSIRTRKNSCHHITILGKRIAGKEEGTTKNITLFGSPSHYPLIDRGIA